MRLRQAAFYTGLLFVAILITGCVYVRLLKLKGQLSEFERHFRIEDEQKLTLVFLEPVLLEDDIVWILKSGPLARQETEGGEVWEYVFEKQYPDSKGEEGNFDIPVDMLFEDEKLQKVSFPERFLKYLSKPMLARMFRSMGDAEISKLKRTADSEFQGSDLDIPSKHQIVDILGEPFSAKDSDQKTEFIYRYNLKKSESGSSGETFKLTTKFSFRDGDDRLIKAEADLNGLVNISMDFSATEPDINRKRE